MEDVKHLANTYKAREEVKQRFKDDIKDLNDDFKTLEKKVITMLLEKKEHALQIDDLIMSLKEKKRSLSKSEQIEKIIDILKTPDVNISSENLALALVNATKQKSNDVSSYSLNIIKINTGEK